MQAAPEPEGGKPDPTNAAQDLVKDVVRNCPFIPFHREDVIARHDATRLCEIIGLESGSTEKLRAVFETVGVNAEISCPGVKALQETANHEITGFFLSLSGAAEWPDVIRYAFGTAGDEALTRLSEPAEDLLSRIESGELADFVKELSIRHRLRFFGWSSHSAQLSSSIARFS